ncbi:SDR family NAD(P)-dependent oxidoreductase [Crossiella sp. CA-258035]|uniref:SDR family NAD(P)-dependent oxidoreductase n=1 Tax=Crossiella sp. CA-258035 TaxID=2981138 RepID=UPI0024BC0389|nr:SDR family oxidoreductase [Crossiella sp. CA-258035]WHT16222.1 SDR family NAD(P)-dependent oxidoreductase [Crossiella sp. CA-258035]
MSPVTILTGGSTGIGAAVLTRLLAAGRRVLVLGRSAPQAKQEVDFLPCDLSTEDGVADAQAAVLAYLGERETHAEVLINNAGGGLPCPAEELSAETLRADLTLNLLAPMLLCATVLPGMRAAGRGVVVNVASTAGRRGVAYLHGYGSAKAGLLNFTQSLAAEVVADGIRVNAVCPGAAHTELAETGRAQLSRLHGLELADYQQRMAKATGLSRLLSADEVAEVVCWLAEGHDRPLTGQALNVCGTLEMG